MKYLICTCTNVCNKPPSLSYKIKPQNKLYDDIKRKRKRSDSVLWQMPLHPQKNPKSKRDNIKNATKTLITQRLWIDFGRSVGVTAVTPLVWLKRFTSAQMPIYKWHVYFHFVIVSETAVLVFRNEFLRTVGLSVWRTRTSYFYH